MAACSCLMRMATPVGRHSPYREGPGSRLVRGVDAEEPSAGCLLGPIPPLGLHELRAFGACLD